MLKEVPQARQNPGEPLRRCFFSEDEDLVVWVGADDTPVAFELSYGKYVGEHTIRWSERKGFMHHGVDNGEADPLRKKTPLLVADGIFDATSVSRTFEKISVEMPRDLAGFVAARLKEHPEYRE